MTEPLILMCFVPFALLGLFSIKRAYPLLSWSSVAIAALCLGLFIFLKKDDPLSWVPVASFFILVMLDSLYSRRLRVLPLLGCLFLGQALISKEAGVILLLIAFSDAFFCADLFSSSEASDKAKAIQGIYQAVLSLVPAALGVLLHLQGQALIAAVACTIVFRLFSWPLNHWVYDVHKEARLFLIYAGSISTFGLWHAQEISTPGIWPFIWLSIAVIFSLGAKYNEMYTALSLGVFAISPSFGVLAVCLWPVLASQGFGVFAVALGSLLSGALIVNQLTNFLSVEGAFALAVVAAFALARVFVGTPRKRVRWYFEALNFTLALVLMGLVTYVVPLTVPAPESPALVFAGVFLLTVILGLALYKKRPAFFDPRKNIPASFFSKDIISLDFLEDKAAPPAQVKIRPFLSAFFRALETEAYVVVLMGLLGLTLLWGST